jgi:cytoskeletal protein CcmA (bactofilin family)
LHIGDTGHIVGNLDGEHIRVDGSVEGDVRARESIEINGRVHGNIFYSGTIRLGPNAVMDGQLKRVSRDRVIDAPTEKVPPLSVVQRDAVSL